MPSATPYEYSGIPRTGFYVAALLIAYQNPNALMQVNHYHALRRMDHLQDGQDDMAQFLHSEARSSQRGIEIPPLGLKGTLSTPSNAHSLVVFVHGSGSSRLSPCNVAVAALKEPGTAPLLFDLLLPEEEVNRANVFDIEFLSQRLIDVLRWTGRETVLSRPPLGLFGASTGAAAALVGAASEIPCVRAVVSRGGRPDLPGHALGRIKAATLLIVGGNDHGVIELNQAGLPAAKAHKCADRCRRHSSVRGTGALQLVTAQAAQWFEAHL